MGADPLLCAAASRKQPKPASHAKTYAGPLGLNDSPEVLARLSPLHPMSYYKLAIQ